MIHTLLRNSLGRINWTVLVLALSIVAPLVVAQSSRSTVVLTVTAPTTSIQETVITAVPTSNPNYVPPSSSSNTTAIIVGVVVGVVVLLAAILIGFFLYRKNKKKNRVESFDQGLPPSTLLVGATPGSFVHGGIPPMQNTQPSPFYPQAEPVYPNDVQDDNMFLRTLNDS